MNKMTETKHSKKMMGLCVAFGVVALVLLASGFGAGALFIIPCLVMLGAMVWMMGGMGGGNSSRGDDLR